jgi:hypothetical protein
MNKPKKTGRNHPVTRRERFFRSGVLVSALLIAGAVTAIAKYELRGSGPTQGAAQVAQAKNDPGGNQQGKIAGRKLPLNVQTLQQGPLTQAQAQQIADALKDNQSTEGLVQVQRPDGSVSIDLQGRFQNVVMAKRNEDGSVSQACVDNSKAASAFLQSDDSSHAPESGTGRRSPVKE